MKFRIVSFAFVASVSSVVGLFGQDPGAGGNVTPVDLVGSAEVGTYIGSGQYRPSYEEGVLRGEAEVARGRANYNYLSAEALKSLEQARSLNVDTRMKGLENYWTARRINYDATLGQIRRFSTEQMAAIAKKEAPERLSAGEYDPFSGRLRWPAILRAADFAPHREAVEQVFKKRTTQDVGPETEFHATVRELTDEMELMLHRRIDRLPPMEYMVAKRFLNGLEQEAQLPPGAAASAKR